MIDIYLDDALHWLSTLKDSSVDLVLTDLPYESLEKYRAKGTIPTTTRLTHSDASSNDWFEVFTNDKFPALFKELYRVLKNNTHAYLFSDPKTSFIMHAHALAAGFTYWNTVIWDKEAIGMGYHYRRTYEMVLFFEKGKRNLNDLSIPDLISRKMVRNRYPTEKPENLASVFINNSTEPGELVIDPFFGSGVFLVEAARHNRRAAGSDVSVDACDEAINKAVFNNVPICLY